jgi:ribosome-associated heat shock protein Hsp15
VSRLFKTRSGAKRACEDGRVKIGRKRAKPSSPIGESDNISITRRGKVVFYEVLGISSRSLPAGKAAELYLEKEIVERKGNELMKLIEKAENRAGDRQGKGRPTKRDRRMIRKIRGR